MLLRLRIQNFAIIQSLDLELPTGFIAITGETGAGKSIIFDAISVCLGGRASTDMIRHGTDKAVLEVEMTVPEEQQTRIAKILEAADCDMEEVLHIRRVIADGAQNKIFINGVRVSKNVLTDISKGLVDIIGQHASHELLSVESHIGILDTFANQNPLSQEVSGLVSRYRELDREVQQLQNQEDTRKLKMEKLQQQLDDIDMAALTEGEDERLAKEIDRLSSAEVLRESTSEMSYLLGGRDGSASDLLSSCMRSMQKIAHLDEAFEPMLDTITKFRIELEEMSRDLGRMSERVQVSPEEIELMQERLHLIEKLKKKHGGSVTAVLAAKQVLQGELEVLLGQSSRIKQAKKESLLVQQECLQKAVVLSHLRQASAKEMEGLVEKELQQLGMPHCRFQVQFVHKNAQGIVSRVEDATVEGLSHCGLDHVEYLISPNPGEGFQSMAKIASGGELSRILLALKVALIQTDPVSTYIFDEVDTGIGGGIAETVGHKLQQVGTSRQVLCISHLPQVISSAHHHLQVRKQVVDNRTSSTADYLDMEQRVNEVARMLGGIEITDKTRAHAQEMIRVNQPKVLHLHERKWEQMG